ncbi:sulfate transporter family protein [Alkalihalophilus pseudofirmus OF4]|uniref:Sulfate transporter family protein n=1 Tax=Alkalihalophilus pseudofirmus (strain ATCC BAA-2126 / JCM 17055 / OF4) TaxID=398511 RepID=D3FXY6_ALKPO|nr:solute carrier family 26 protein [Alkalihalophilus pseudofirmus]ADC50745.1 sulfate transporter family protein [Alkalihalophilus pseudofirmus OF4]
MLKKLFPGLEWMLTYQKHDLRGDLSAGLIVAIMLIPQGMAYAMLAGLPPVIGLYASTIPLLVYALFGSSRQLAVGPVAMVSLLVLTGVQGLAEPGSSEYISLVLLLALMVGVIQLSLGLLRLGFITDFISHAVISGFTSAAAIVIGFSQLKHLLGIQLPSSENVFELLFEAGRQLSSINSYTLFIGLTSILILVLMKKYVPKLPAPLVVVVYSTVVVYLFDLHEKGVSIIGEVPDGLPSLSLPSWSFEAVSVLMPVAITIAIIGFVESFAMAKVIATKEKYKVDANRELVGLGLANVSASTFSGYPVTGGFSRSAVNYGAGAKTGLAAIITAILIVLTLLFFTSWFYYMPNAVLAAIIMVAVYGLIDVGEAKHLFKVKKIDGFTLLITFAATLTLGIEMGIFIGIVFSLIVFIWRSANPHMAELGYVEEMDAYRNTARFNNAKTVDHLSILRIDSPLYFANIQRVESRIQQSFLKSEEIDTLILDFQGVNDIDAVAIDHLEELMNTYQELNKNIYLCDVKGPVRDTLKQAGWYETFKGKIEFKDLEHVIAYLKSV